MRGLIPIWVLLVATPVVAGEPGWRGVVFAQGAERERIKSTPITERPYRPFHVYGNALRRIHYRGTFLPAPRDFIQSGTSLITRE